MRPLRRTMQICYHERVFIKSFSNVPLDFGLDVPPEIDVGMYQSRRYTFQIWRCP